MKIITAFLFLLFPLLAQAEDDLSRLAVLEFTGVGIDKVSLGVISDSARTGIVQVVDTDEVLVMTKESILEVLKDMGKDITCMEGACEVEMGRNIGADYVMTGSVAQMGSEYILTLKFFDTQTSALLASETMDARDLNTLRKATPELAQKVVIKGLKLEPEKPQITQKQPPIRRASPEQAKKYRRASRIFLLSSGVMFGATIWTHQKYPNLAHESDAELVYALNNASHTAAWSLLGAYGVTRRIAKSKE